MACKNYGCTAWKKTAKQHITPDNERSRTTRKCTNLPIVWITDECVRNRNHGRRRREGKKEQMKTAKSNKINGIHELSQAQIPSKKSSHSQQHVLLVLLENSTDVLEDVGGEEVDPAVDDVTHKGARLFHIMQDLFKKNKFQS